MNRVLKPGMILLCLTLGPNFVHAAGEDLERVAIPAREIEFTVEFNYTKEAKDRAYDEYVKAINEVENLPISARSRALQEITDRGISYYLIGDKHGVIHVSHVIPGKKPAQIAKLEVSASLANEAQNAFEDLLNLAIVKNEKVQVLVFPVNVRQLPEGVEITDLIAKEKPKAPSATDLLKQLEAARLEVERLTLLLNEALRSVSENHQKPAPESSASDVATVTKVGIAR